MCVCVCVCVQSHPGTNVSVIDLFDRSSSLQPMWKQVEGFKAAINPIMQNAEDGVNFICYSQGGCLTVCVFVSVPLVVLDLSFSCSLFLFCGSFSLCLSVGLSVCLSVCLSLSPALSLGLSLCLCVSLEKDGN